MKNKWKQFTTWLYNKFDDKKTFVIHAQELLNANRKVIVDIRIRPYEKIKDASLTSVTSQGFTFQHAADGNNDYLSFSHVRNVTIVEVS